MEKYYLLVELNDLLEVRFSINEEKIPISKFERVNKNFYVFEIPNQIGLSLSLRVSFNGLMGSSINIKIIDHADNLIWQSRARILKVSGFENTYTVNLGKTGDSQFDWTSVSDGDHQKSNHRTYLKHNIEKTVPLENTSVFVYFATDRGKIESKDELFPDYNGERSMLSYGICEVNIPKKRKIGELSRPAWWKFEFQENPNKHFLILGGSELNIDEFFVSLGERITLSDENDLFVFIHGFNTNFQDAIMSGDFGETDHPISV